MSSSAEEIRVKFKNRKNSIISLLGEAANFFHDLDNQEKKQVFEKLSEDVVNGEFSIVVVGEFSAGKSTLLNALMGERMLPSYKSETTATVNFLKHKEKQIDMYPGKVFYKDGTEKGINDTTLDTITKYVSTRGENIASTVKYLELYLDSDFLKDGVTLVDSPGLNGVAIGHKEITEQQILKSHASIFVFSGDHPGTETEFNFLGDLSEKVKTIFLVMNKIDDIHEDEGETAESVIQNLKDNYKKQFPEVTTVPEIWPVAALPALVARSKEKIDYRGRVDWSIDEKKELESKSLLRDFETRLMRFLTQGEKTRAELLAPIQKIIDVVGESRAFLEKEKSALEGKLDADSLIMELGTLENSQSLLEEKLSNSKRDIERALKEEFANTEEIFLSQVTKLKDSNVKRMEEFDDLEEVKDFCESLGRNLQRRISNFAKNADDKMRIIVHDIVLMQFDKYVDSVDADIHDVGGINVSFDNQEQLAVDFVDFGIEAMDERRKALEARLKQAEQEKRQVDQEYRKARRTATLIATLKMEINQLEEHRKEIRMHLAQGLPQRQRFHKQVPVDKERGGLFGTIADFLVGKKSSFDEVEVIDSTEHDEAKSHWENEEKSVQKEIEAKKLELSEKYHDNMEEAEAKQDELGAAIITLREQLTKQEKMDREEIQKKHAKEIRKIQRKVEEYCDSVSDSICNAVKKEFKKAREAYVSLIQAKISADLTKAMERKKKEIEILRSKMEGATAEKNAQIIDLEKKIACAEEIITKAIQMESDIKSEDVDQIVNVSISSND